MRKEFLPFSTPAIGDDEINEVVDSLRSGWITTGPKVKRFEEEFKAYVGSPFAVPLSSATAGLHLTLLALKIEPGDEIITTPMTFASTVSMIILCGGVPVLVDIEPGTLNIDVQKIREKITPRTKAIIPCTLPASPVTWTALCPGQRIQSHHYRRCCTRRRHRIQGREDRLFQFHFHLLLSSQQEHYHRRRGDGLYP